MISLKSYRRAICYFGGTSMAIFLCGAPPTIGQAQIVTSSASESNNSTPAVSKPTFRVWPAGLETLYAKVPDRTGENTGSQNIAKEKATIDSARHDASVQPKGMSEHLLKQYEGDSKPLRDFASGLSIEGRNPAVAELLVARSLAHIELLQRRTAEEIKHTNQLFIVAGGDATDAQETKLFRNDVARFASNMRAKGWTTQQYVGKGETDLAGSIPATLKNIRQMLADASEIRDGEVMFVFYAHGAKHQDAEKTHSIGL